MISIEQDVYYSEDKFSDGCMSGSYLVPASGLSFHSHNSVLCGIGILNFIKTNLSFFSFNIHFLWTVSGTFAYLKHLKTFSYILFWKLYYVTFYIYIYGTSQIKFLEIKVYPYYLWIFNWPSTIYWKDCFCTTNFSDVLITKLMNTRVNLSLNSLCVSLIYISIFAPISHIHNHYRFMSWCLGI